ncbi:MAG TPA: hypothetical protein VGL66_06420 [Caulobacteraceae bacterium]
MDTRGEIDVTTTMANDKHYAAVAKQHAQKPNAFIGAALKGEAAKTTAKADMAQASGKGVPARAVVSKLAPGVSAEQGL